MPGLGVSWLGALGARALLASLAIDQAAAVRLAGSAGVAPPGPTEESEPSVQLELQPGVGFRLRTPRSTLALRLGAQFQYRQPNLGGLDRPLWLTRGAATHQYSLSPRWVWQTEASGTYGEVDYTEAVRTADTLLAAELTDAVVNVLSAEANTGFTWQVSRHYRLQWAAVGGYTEFEGGEATVAFPKTVTVGMDLAQRFELSPRDELRIPIRPRYYFVDPGGDWFSLSGEVQYERMLSPRTQLEAAAGVTAARLEREEVPAGEAQPRDEGTEIFPSASLALEHAHRDQPGARLSQRVGAAFDATFDPILGEVRPVVGVEASVRADITRRWTLLLLVTGYTGTASEPREQENATESFLEARVALTRPLLDWLIFDVGARASTLGPHLSRSWEFIDEQAWVFAGLTASFGSRGTDIEPFNVLDPR